MRARAKLDGIVFVLHEPQDLVNIAGVIRVMKNMGLRDLRLVRPAEFDAWRIEGIAHKTHDLIRRVRRFETLAEAIADCTWVLGATARGRTAKRTGMWAREAGSRIVERALEGGPIAVVFGREDQGLSNEDLDRCHALVTIPTDPAHPSLNLQHAAAIVAYEIRLAAGGEDAPRKPPRRRAAPATVAQYEQLFGDIEVALDAVDFFKSHTRGAILRSVREAAHRARLDNREVSLLRAMAIEVRRFLDRVLTRASGGRGTGTEREAEAD